MQAAAGLNNAASSNSGGGSSRTPTAAAQAVTTIPPPCIHVRPGSRQSGFMVQAEMEGRFPVPPNVLFQLLTHKENIFSGVVESHRRSAAEVAPAVPPGSSQCGPMGTAADPRVRVYEETVVTKAGQKGTDNALHFKVEEDARNPAALTRRSNLMQGPQLERMESFWVVRPAADEASSGSSSGTDTAGGGCIVRLEQGLAPKGVPALLRPAVGAFLRSATEKAVRQNHADLMATVQQVLSGATVDEAASAARAQYKNGRSKK